MRRLALIFLSHALRPAAVALVSVTGLGCLLLGAQVLSRAPVVPGPAGAARVVLGMLPVALATAVPAAVLSGAVAASRSWALGGEWLGLAVSGRGTRRLVPGLMAVGMLSGLLQGTLTHHLDPAGRRQVRDALLSASADLGLRASEPLALPDGVLRVREVRGEEWTGVFLAQADTLMSARRGRLVQGRLVLEDGVAHDLGSGWEARFGRATVPLRLPGPRFELADRSLGSLRALLARKRAAGESAAYETLILYKRTTGAIAVPLMLLLALPLGGLHVRPAAAALGVLVSWWVAVRIFDQAVGALGPTLAAAAPLVGLSMLTVACWARWRRR
ncbi:MAG: LptF/LptG family permease [Myxococcota bacterium]|nr:LptF/LptG family permease [Myxococcota bacterium]